jgi:hypothetical protein
LPLKMMESTVTSGPGAASSRTRATSLMVSIS